MTDADFEVCSVSSSDSDASSLYDAAALQTEMTGLQPPSHDIDANDTDDETQSSKDILIRHVANSRSVKRALFNTKGSCVLPTVGTAALAKTTYRFNPKLPAAETLLTPIEVARVHLLVYHTLSSHLIDNGYMNFTHKRVGVKSQLLQLKSSYKQPMSAQQATQIKIALKCLKTLQSEDKLLLENHPDAKV